MAVFDFFFFFKLTANSERNPRNSAFTYPFFFLSYIYLPVSAVWRIRTIFPSLKRSFLVFLDFSVKTKFKEVAARLNSLDRFPEASWPPDEGRVAESQNQPSTVATGN